MPLGPLVAGEDWAIRFVHPEHFLNGKVQRGNLPTHEFQPPPARPSIYIESIRTLEELERAVPKWKGYAVCRFQVKDLSALGFEVRFSPEECDVDAIKDAHASIENMTRTNRGAAITLLNDRLHRSPPP